MQNVRASKQYRVNKQNHRRAVSVDELVLVEQIVVTRPVEHRNHRFEWSGGLVVGRGEVVYRQRRTLTVIHVDDAQWNHRCLGQGNDMNVVGFTGHGLDFLEATPVEKRSNERWHVRCCRIA